VNRRHDIIEGLILPEPSEEWVQLEVRVNSCCLDFPRRYEEFKFVLIRRSFTGHEFHENDHCGLEFIGLKIQFFPVSQGRAIHARLTVRPKI